MLDSVDRRQVPLDLPLLLRRKERGDARDGRVHRGEGLGPCHVVGRGRVRDAGHGVSRCRRHPVLTATVFSVALRPQETVPSIRGREPRSSTSSFTQLLKKEATVSVLLYVHRDRTDY